MRMPQLSPDGEWLYYAMEYCQKGTLERNLEERHRLVLADALKLAIGICQGVAHRFPRLKFVSVEFNTGWIAHWREQNQNQPDTPPYCLHDGFLLYAPHAISRFASHPAVDPVRADLSGCRACCVSVR